ncbi:MAG: diaminopimelate epimerase [Gammaproteobacteria bacterium]|nr:diaminopimelate epimerase [Gammaproteobacteria bacterium]
MKLFFTKMQGAGNDFVVIDQISQDILFKPEWAQLISCRKLGVGCDQLLLLEPPKSPQADFFYRIFNSDGTEVEQCGNGARCIGQFISYKKLSPKASWEIETINSKMTVALTPNHNGIRVNLGLPNFDANSLPFTFTEHNIVNNNIFKLQIPQLEDLEYLKNKTLLFSIVSIGNPHVVINMDTIMIDEKNTNLVNNYINKIGSTLNNHPQFPKGVNVNFIRVINSHTIGLTTYERGVGVTAACGTGSCAAAICARGQNLVTENFIQVENSGGTLGVNWANSDDSPVWLTGASNIVYEGYIEL